MMREDLKSLKHHNIPQEVKDKIIRLYEQGLEKNIIAERFGKSNGTIHAIIKRHLESKNEKPQKV